MRWSVDTIARKLDDVEEIRQTNVKLSRKEQNRLTSEEAAQIAEVNQVKAELRAKTSQRKGKLQAAEN